MRGLKDILNLMADGRTKIVVVDDAGEPKFVILPHDEYESLADCSAQNLGRRIEDLTQEAEDLNRKIKEAQMEDLENLPVAESGTEAEAEESDDNYYIEALSDQVD